MKSICRFCNEIGHINSVFVKTNNDQTFELEWCSECGKIQNKFR